jgi:peroxiredoxin
LPSINALHREYQARGLTVLLVNLREDPAKVARAMKDRGYVAPALLDRDGEVADAYEVTGTPTTYVVGRDGRVLGRAIGPRPWTEAPGRAFLQALLVR